MGRGSRGVRGQEVNGYRGVGVVGGQGKWW